MGGFLALWVIGYGIVQASAPRYLRRRSDSEGPPDARRLGWWTAALVVPLGAIMAALASGVSPAATLTVGLAVFGVVFAERGVVFGVVVGKTRFGRRGLCSANACVRQPLSIIIISGIVIISSSSSITVVVVVVVERLCSAATKFST